MSASPYNEHSRPARLHDRDVVIAARGRLCRLRKKINIATVLARQRIGIKEVHEGVWLISIMHRAGIRRLRAEETSCTTTWDPSSTSSETLQPVDDPFGPRLSPMS